MDIVNEVILTDDLSQDNTIEKPKNRYKEIHIHKQNKGYGGNQKTCYNRVFGIGCRYRHYTHPDYQYTPKLITQWHVIANDVYPVVLGSHFRKGP